MTIYVKAMQKTKAIKSKHQFPPVGCIFPSGHAADKCRENW